MSTNTPLPRSNPDKQGVSAGAIASFLNAVEQHEWELHGFMLIRNGHVIAEKCWSPYSSSTPHPTYSLSKCFISSAVGLAVDEQLFTLEDAVVSFFPGETTPEIQANMGAMRVKHLLTMASGHIEDTQKKVREGNSADAQAEWRIGNRQDGNWIRGFFEIPIREDPGCCFVYNSGASYMLSAIVQKTSGQPLLEYLNARLFEPLGIAKPSWTCCPMGVNIGWKLRLSLEDIARFGQLYLQQGRWGDRRLLSRAWVEEATASHIASRWVNSEFSEHDVPDWCQGYGYQFWRCRHRGFFGYGVHGQFCMVLPEQATVVAITGGRVGRPQALLDLLWQHVLPAIPVSDGKKTSKSED